MAFEKTNIKKVFQFKKKNYRVFNWKNRDVDSLQDINWLWDLTFLVYVISVMNDIKTAR